MIKNVEEMNAEELSYVKDAISKYLNGYEKEDYEAMLHKWIKKTNNQIKINKKDIRKIQRKIAYLNVSESNYFLTALGTLLSACISGWLLTIDAIDPIEMISIIAGGSGASFALNFGLNKKREKDEENVYQDLDLILEDNDILNRRKEELLECESYHKALKKFINN